MTTIKIMEMMTKMMKKETDTFQGAPVTAPLFMQSNPSEDALKLEEWPLNFSRVPSYAGGLNMPRLDSLNAPRLPSDFNNLFSQVAPQNNGHNVPKEGTEGQNFSNGKPLKMNGQTEQGMPHYNPASYTSYPNGLGAFGFRQNSEEALYSN